MVKLQIAFYFAVFKLSCLQVREMESKNADLVGGALRDEEGRWSQNCFQILKRNYSLAFEEGYETSQGECLRCEFFFGPFLARTSAMGRMVFNIKLGRHTARLNYALQVSPSFIDQESSCGNMLLQAKFSKASKTKILVCPDVMFETANQVELSRKEALELARQHRLASLKSPSGKLFQFTSTDFPTFCPQEDNVMLFPICMQVTVILFLKKNSNSIIRCKSMKDLSSTLKLIFDVCERTGSICQLQEGTLLGAVKLGSILPWERDADIMVNSNNFSLLLDKLQSKEFPWVASQSMW